MAVLELLPTQNRKAMLVLSFRRDLLGWSGWSVSSMSEDLQAATTKPSSLDGVLVVCRAIHGNSYLLRCATFLSGAVAGGPFEDH